MAHPITALRAALVSRVVEGPGVASPEARRAAFDRQAADARTQALLDKVARQAWTVTDADVAAVQGAGLDDDAIFELVISAAIGQSTRQIDAALAVLDEATPAPGGAR